MTAEYIRSFAKHTEWVENVKFLRPAKNGVSPQSKCKIPGVSIAKEDVSYGAWSSFVCFEKKNLFLWETFSFIHSRRPKTACVDMFSPATKKTEEIK